MQIQSFQGDSRRTPVFVFLKANSTEIPQRSSSPIRVEGEKTDGADETDDRKTKVERHQAHQTPDDDRANRSLEGAQVFDPRRW